MKNALESFAAQSGGWSENDCVNMLKDAGIISDNCVTAHDVCTGDCEKAVEFLREELF